MSGEESTNDDSQGSQEDTYRLDENIFEFSTEMSGSGGRGGGGGGVEGERGRVGGVLVSEVRGGKRWRREVGGEEGRRVRWEVGEESSASSESPWKHNRKEMEERGQLEEEEEEVKEKEEEEEGSSSDGSAVGLPGTTPPSGNRFAKFVRRLHKYKGGKKLSLGHIPNLRYRDKSRRSHSMMSLSSTPKEGEDRIGHSRRYTAPSVSVAGRGREGGRKEKREGGKRERREAGRRRREGASRSSGGGYLSPHQAESKNQKRKKKQIQRKIARDDKQAQSSSHLSYSPNKSLLSPHNSAPRGAGGAPCLNHRRPLEPVVSVDLPDYTPSLLHHSPLLSLQPAFFPLRSASAGISFDSPRSSLSGPHRLLRSYSDAQFSLPPSVLTGDRSQRQVSARCPPDRKQFYRNFTKALKYSGISRQRPITESHTHHPHMTRHMSENLNIENPSGIVMETLWRELQAYLHGRSEEEQEQLLLFYQDKIDKVLLQVNWGGCVGWVRVCEVCGCVRCEGGSVTEVSV